MKKIRVIIKRPDEEWGHVTHISNRLENLQNTVGGYIECVSLDEKTVVICNEEGLLQHLPYNVKLNNSMFVGTIIICSIKDEEFADLKMSFDEWKKMLEA